MRGVGGVIQLPTEAGRLRWTYLETIFYIYMWLIGRLIGVNRGE
jgi:hypothetical protein